MESGLRVSAQPELTRPVLIAAFRGWNDGAQAASLAAGYLARLWDAEQIAEVDPEGFFDFQATRPHVSLVDGITRRIDWPGAAPWAGCGMRSRSRRSTPRSSSIPGHPARTSRSSTASPAGSTGRRPPS